MAVDPRLSEFQHLHNHQVATAAARELVTRLHERNIHDGLVVDLGCGSGMTAKLLTESGFDVIGVDISPEMIELATRTAPDATFLQESLFEVDIPECVAVTSIGESINYAINESTSPGEVSQLIERIHESLVAGGLAMLDAAGPDRITAGETRHDRFEGTDWELFVTTTGSADGQRLTRDISMFRAVGDGWRRNKERHEQHLYSPEVITERLLLAGFDVVVLSGYDNLSFPDGWAGFLARKRVGGTRSATTGRR